MRNVIVFLLVMLVSAVAYGGILDMCLEYETVAIDPTPQIVTMAFGDGGRPMFTDVDSIGEVSAILCEKYSNPWSTPGIGWNCICDEVPFKMNIKSSCFGNEVEVHIESLNCFGDEIMLDWYYTAYWDSFINRYKAIGAFPDGDLTVEIEKRLLNVWVYISYISISDSEDSFVYLFKMPLYEFGCAKSLSGYYVR